MNARDEFLKHLAARQSAEMRGTLLGALMVCNGQEIILRIQRTSDDWERFKNQLDFEYTNPLVVTGTAWFSDGTYSLCEHGRWQTVEPPPMPAILY